MKKNRDFSQKLVKITLIIILGILTPQISAQDFETLSSGKIKDVKVEIGTFLGSWQRNYYGNKAPTKLQTIWRSYLGKGKTVISKKIGEKEWEGSGWTGQPLLVRENDRLFLIHGSLDHNLKKFDAQTGKIIWQFKFDDVIKGTGTIWQNKNATTLNESLIILQGSRRGLKKDLYSKVVPSFRAVSYFTGEELWRMNVKQTNSYSRDVDGSAIVLNDTAYIGLENALFTTFSPDPQKAKIKDNLFQPKIYQQITLYDKNDIKKHGGNLVVESSPCLLNNHIYITTGAGHVVGYNLKTNKIDWDFYIGSDIDGSPVVTLDSCILVTVEKQYIEGKGGVFKLDPKKKSEESVVWYFAVEDDSLESWAGGIIGSAGVNDLTRRENEPRLAAFIGIDGFLYVVNHQKINLKKEKIPGPNLKNTYCVPDLLFKYKLGPSISTPVFVGNKLIAAGYKGIYIFEIKNGNNFNLIAKRQASAFESTPIVFDEKIYIGSKDGFLYCFGQK